MPTPSTRRKRASCGPFRGQFAERYRQAGGDLPDPGNDEEIETVRERLADPDAEPLIEAWFCVDEWVQPVLYLSQRADVRAMLPQRDRLLAAIPALRETHGTPHWFEGLLTVLDNEQLIVLDRGYAGSGNGYRVTISGIGDNFQLHTLLAGRQLTPDEAKTWLSQVAPPRDQ